MGFNGLLTVPGRKTGVPRTTALAIIQDGGRRWVWAPWGEVHWVRNLRAAGPGDDHRARSRGSEVRAVELDAAQRVAFFRDTLEPLARQMRGGMTFIRTSMASISATRSRRPKVASSSSCIRCAERPLMGTGRTSTVPDASTWDAALLEAEPLLESVVIEG